MGSSLAFLFPPSPSWILYLPLQQKRQLTAPATKAWARDNGAHEKVPGTKSEAIKGHLISSTQIVRLCSFSLQYLKGTKSWCGFPPLGSQGFPDRQSSLA